MRQNVERPWARLERFVGRITRPLSVPQRRRFSEYAMGVLLPGERKSMEPMAARIDPEHAMARYKTFQRFSVSKWDDRAVRRAAFEWAESSLLSGRPPRAWLVDDTGFPKQGIHSVFVQRQYSGTLGKVGNCQVAVSLSVCSDKQSLPIDFDLYMPDEWASDRGRRAACKVPRTLKFRSKPEIALDLIDAALRDEIPQAPVVADSGYGNNGPFREALDCFGLEYMLELHSTTTVYCPAEIRTPKTTLDVRDVGIRLGRQSFKLVNWREGTKGKLSSRFAALRVRARRDGGAAFRPDREQDLWLLIEWPSGEAQPTKFWFSNLPVATTLKELVALAKLRGLIERDYEDLKEELGLDHFEGRSYVGWHHHVTVCLAAYAFLISERGESFPPSAVEFPTSSRARARDARRSGRAAAA